jgi:hypothetical protein
MNHRAAPADSPAMTSAAVNGDALSALTVPNTGMALVDRGEAWAGAAAVAGWPLDAGVPPPIAGLGMSPRSDAPRLGIVT